MSQAQNSTQMVEASRKKLDQLVLRRQKAEVQIESERKKLADAQAEAMAEFGVSDLAALRALYDAQAQENNSMAVEFIMAVDTVEQQLVDVERQLSSAAKA